jgi:mannose-6-phosphate isomerase-like protein (cupin superfamily)
MGGKEYAKLKDLITKFNGDVKWPKKVTTCDTVEGDHVNPMFSIYKDDRYAICESYMQINSDGEPSEVAPHVHEDITIIIMVVSGAGYVLVGNKCYAFSKTGDTVVVPPNTLHSVVVSESTVFLSVTMPPDPSFP